MQLSFIRPYVRLARTLTLSKTSSLPARRTPYDARLFYTLQGSGIITIGNQEINMKKGSALLINSGVEYTIKAPTEEDVTYIAVNFDYTDENRSLTTPIAPAFENNYKPSNLLSHVEFQDKKESKLNSFLYVESSITIEKKAKRLISEYQKKLLGFELVTCSIMSQIVVELLRMNYVPTLRENITNAILEYIDEHYAEPLTNQSIAHYFRFHPNYLSNLIKQTTGTPLHKYLVNVRLYHAAELLESGKYTIGEVSDIVGFCNIYHFSHTFKKEFGTTPSEFAK